MSDRKQSSNIAAVVLICALLLVLLATVGGFFAFRAYVVLTRAVAEQRRAEDVQQQLELAMKAHDEAYPSSITEPNAAPATDVERLRFVAWNVESGGNDPAVITQQLAELGRYDVFGLTEVSPANTRRYRAAIRQSYKSLVTVTGGNDRMMIVYNADRLEELEHAELEAHDGVRMNDVNFRHRSPLMAKFRDKQSGVDFQASVESFGPWQCRVAQEQAKALRLWAADQELPIIGIGDYSFEYDFPTQKGNAAFDEFLAEDTWRWVKPSKLVDTNWSDRDEDGIDDYPDSCLDFTFVAGEAKQWQSRSRVIVRNGDFPDDDKTSDHRPVELVLVPR